MSTSEVLRVRGVALPSEESAEFWIIDGTLTREPTRGATTVVEGGWLVPGLVDVHTHPGAERPATRSTRPCSAGTPQHMCTLA